MLSDLQRRREAGAITDCPAPLHFYHTIYMEKDDIEIKEKKNKKII